MKNIQDKKYKYKAIWVSPETHLRLKSKAMEVSTQKQKIYSLKQLKEIPQFEGTMEALDKLTITNPSPAKEIIN